MSLRVSNFDKDHLFVLANNKNRFFKIDGCSPAADGSVKKSPVTSSPLCSPSSELQTHLEESNQFYVKLEKQLEKKHATILRRSITSEETTTVPKQVLKSIQVRTRRFLSSTRTTFDKSIDHVTGSISTGWIWNCSLRILTVLAMLLIFFSVQTWRFIVWPIVWPSNENPFFGFKSEGTVVVPGKILVAHDDAPNLTTLLRQQQECVAASSDYNIHQCMTSDDDEEEAEGDSTRRLQ